MRNYAYGGQPFLHCFRDEVAEYEIILYKIPEIYITDTRYTSWYFGHFPTFPFPSKLFLKKCPGISYGTHSGWQQIRPLHMIHGSRGNDFSGPLYGSQPTGIITYIHKRSFLWINNAFLRKKRFRNQQKCLHTVQALSKTVPHFI